MSEADANDPAQSRTNTIVTIAVVCVAVVGVLAMRFMSPRGATANDPAIDKKIDAILKWEAEEPVSPDPLIEVSPGGPVAPEGGPPRNPFAGEDTRDEPPPADPAQARRLEIEKAAGQLRLQAVITGGNPVATINGRPVGPDSVLKVSPGEGRPLVELRVISILPDSVTLEAKDPDLDLTVETTLHLDRP
jgi:hypothetical protein